MNKKDMINNILSRDFTYHPPRNNTDIALYEQIREDTRFYLKRILNVLPKYTKETEAFIKKIDEAVMWANASIARDNYIKAK